MAEMRNFESGATRNVDIDKPDYEGFLSPLVLERFAQYMHSHRKQADGKLRDSDNWQKGIPKEAYIKSAWRHFVDWWLWHRGQPAKETIEEALCALLFNIMGYLHEHLKANQGADRVLAGDARVGVKPLPMQEAATQSDYAAERLTATKAREAQNAAGKDAVDTLTDWGASVHPLNTPRVLLRSDGLNRAFNFFVPTGVRLGSDLPEVRVNGGTKLITKCQVCVLDHMTRAARVDFFEVLPKGDEIELVWPRAAPLSAGQVYEAPFPHVRILGDGVQSSFKFTLPGGFTCYTQGSSYLEVRINGGCQNALSWRLRSIGIETAFIEFGHVPKMGDVIELEWKNLPELSHDVGPAKVTAARENVMGEPPKIARRLRLAGAVGGKSAFEFSAPGASNNPPDRVLLNYRPLRCEDYEIKQTKVTPFGIRCFTLRLRSPLAAGRDDRLVLIWFGDQCETRADGRISD